MNFLGRLAARQRSETRGVAPRLPSRFLPSGPSTVEAEPDDTDATHRTGIVTDRKQVRQQPLAAPSESTSVPPAAAPITHRTPIPMPTSTGPPAEQQRSQHAANLSVAASPFPKPTDPWPEQRSDGGKDPSDSALSAEAQASSRPPVSGLEGSEGTERTRSGSELLVPSIAFQMPNAPDRMERWMAGEPAAPSVRVTIGRIEVRALVQPTVVSGGGPPARTKTMSLDDYLESRHGAQR